MTGVLAACIVLTIITGVVSWKLAANAKGFAFLFCLFLFLIWGMYVSAWYGHN